MNKIALINIIRTHPAHKELVHERFHRLEIVVHTREQYTLVSQRDAGVGQAIQRLLHLNRQLPRMIYMHAHPERMMFRQHCAQLRRDALRQENRDPRADAEEFYVLDRAQPREQLVELIVAEDESVATA